MDGCIEDKPEIIVKVDDLLLWIKVMMKIYRVMSGPSTYFNGLHIRGPRLVFRGQADSRWSIKSSYERQILEKNSQSQVFTEADLCARERIMLQYFKQRYRGAVTPQTDGEWMALLQHYGCPTRLVDFTHSPFIALYFAVNTKDDEVANQDFAVWAVRNNFSKAYVDRKSQNIRIPISTLKDIMKLRENVSREVDISETVENCQAFDECNNQVVEALFRGDKEIYDPRILTYMPSVLSDRQRDQDALFLMSSNLGCPFMKVLRKELKIANKPPTEINLCEIERNGVFCDEFENAQLIEFQFAKSLVEDVKTLLQISNITHRVMFDDIAGQIKETKEIARTLYK